MIAVSWHFIVDQTNIYNTASMGIFFYYPYFANYSTAYDSRLQRRVAIKKLTKPFEDKEYAKRTHRELKILAHVDHENVSPPCLL